MSRIYTENFESGELEDYLRESIQGHSLSLEQDRFVYAGERRPDLPWQEVPGQPGHYRRTLSPEEVGQLERNPTLPIALPIDPRVPSDLERQLDRLRQRETEQQQRILTEIQRAAAQDRMEEQINDTMRRIMTGGITIPEFPFSRTETEKSPPESIILNQRQLRDACD